MSAWNAPVRTTRLVQVVRAPYSKSRCGAGHRECETAGKTFVEPLAATILAVLVIAIFNSHALIDQPQEHRGSESMPTLLTPPPCAPGGVRAVTKCDGRQRNK
jgi:hypothetical protein